MNNTAIVVFALVAVMNSQAFAETRYMFCYGGGRAALYYSNVFSVAEGTKGGDKAKAFDAFVGGKYGTPVHTQCYTDGTMATADSDKKIREDSDQKSKFPSKVIETGWAGK